MRELDELEEILRLLIQQLPDEDRAKILARLGHVRDASILLEEKHREAIRDRAVIHSLLKKTSEDLLRRYRAIFEYAGTAMVVLEPDGTISLANSDFVTMAGIPLSEIEGKKITAFTDSHLNDWITRSLADDGTQDPQHLHTGEGQIRSSRGAVFDVIARIGLFPGTRQSVLSVTDITNRKRAEEALRQANRKLNLLSGITRHDIKNQLLILTGFLEISKNTVTDPEKSLQFIAKERRIADVISRQISFTREYENLGVNAPAWQNISSVVKTAASSLSLNGVHVDPGNPDLEIYADPLLGKVFFNLIDNALRYGGSTMTTVRVSSEPGNGGLVLIVSDDGEGVAADDKERLFQRGFGKNTGLGLFFSREILAITGITIIENGEPGNGARFEMEIPAGNYRFGSQH